MADRQGYDSWPECDGSAGESWAEPVERRMVKAVLHTRCRGEPRAEPARLFALP